MILLTVVLVEIDPSSTLQAFNMLLTKVGSFNKELRASVLSRDLKKCVFSVMSVGGR